MRHPRGDIPLPVAFLLAALLHVAAIVVVAPGFVRDALGSSTPSALLSPDAITPPEPEPPKLDLGIDAQTPSSMTWIGYDTYLEHIARLSEVEQAEFDDDPGAMSGTETPASDGAPSASEQSDAQAAAEAAEPAEPMEPVEPVKPTEPAEPTDPVEPIEPTEPIELEVIAPQVGPTADDFDPTPVPGLVDDFEAPPTIVGPIGPPADLVDGTPVQPLTADEIESIAAALMPGFSEIRPRPRSSGEGAPPTPQSPVDSPADSPAEAPSEVATEVADAAEAAREASESSAPSSSPAVRRDRDRTGAARDGRGEESDRESTPTATIDVPLAHLRSGRPLASHGLEIMTRNPVFPILTSVTSAPRNPLVEIHFGHDGRPRRAGLLESSGDSRVDGPIIDSLYRWRANGAALEDLDPDDARSTVRITMRILLRNR